jgi:hypothetical protein
MHQPDLPPNWIEVWDGWAALGTGAGSEHPQQKTDWRPVAEMVEAAKKTLKVEAERLRSFLARSDQQLQPWGDPLAVDLGTHRWLANEREENYSDWLAWVIEQLKTPEQVFRLFGEECPTESSTRSTRPTVSREHYVPFGHEGHQGRLDVLIDYEGLPLLDIEVKKGDAEQSDTGKQEGYRRSLEKGHPDRELRHVLLVTSANEATSEGDYVVRTWAEVCVELRRMAAGELKGCMSPLALAMILAFVAAVEENLLGFSSDLIRRIKEGKDSVYFFNTNIVDHIANSLLEPPL